MGIFKRKENDILPEEERYEFLHTVSRQFPFDDVCCTIVKQLQKRNYKVPGIEVELDSYGEGDRKFRKVRMIKSDDFKIWFCRSQGLIEDSNFNNTAAPYEIHIPMKQLCVYEDESGPTLYLYAGKDWEKDRDGFMGSLKVNSKLKGQPKTYLKYSGKDRHFNSRAKLFAFDNDLSREYEPKKKEPKQLSVEVVFKTFTDYLTNVVLKRILEEPISTDVIDILQLPKPIQMPKLNYRILFLGDVADYNRIMIGTKNRNKLSRSSRYGLSVRGVRLLSYDIKINPEDGILPVVHDGFGYCSLSGVDEKNVEVLFSRYLQYECNANSASSIIEITPNRANGIYVADHAALINRRKELGALLASKERAFFTDDEVADFKKARAKTLVPITEYKDNYERPVVLFNREIDLDEVKIVGLLKR